VLLGRKRHPGDVDARRLRQEQAEPAPTGADVQHLLAGVKIELGRDVALLGPLRLSMDASGRSKYAQEYCMSRSRKSR
jgi:hypothetical protein